MKQIQITYKGREEFRKEILALREKYSENTMMFNIFFDKQLGDEVRAVCEVLDSELPDVQYFGCSSNANIEHGVLAEHSVCAVCTVFEDSSAKVEVLDYDFGRVSREQACDDVLDRVSRSGWVKGIELLITIDENSAAYICDHLSEMDEGIALFGGGAMNSISFKVGFSAVISKLGGYCEDGAVFVLMGSDSLSIKTVHISGWRPLGRKFTVTKARGNRLYELNGEPAFEVYHRYIKVDKNELFFLNALEFPMSYERGGTNIMRVSVRADEDGSIIMASDVSEGASLQICYGDPQSILRSIVEVSDEVADFSPEGILVFDCASRRSYWGNEDINRETLPFEYVADTAGFYAAGEFQRNGRLINQHNVTLVIAAMKEGEGKAVDKSRLLQEYAYEGEHVSMVRRLADFIEAATQELEEANRQLELANKQLTVIARTDELTGILNRRALKDMVQKNVDDGTPFSLVMMDLDYFKIINDTFGHDEGDTILKKFTEVMLESLSEERLRCDAARWGGEEFMVMITGADIDVACEAAENIRHKYAECDLGEIGRQTVSCGVTEVRVGESADNIYTRVDMALYCSKNAGRNRTSAM